MSIVKSLFILKEKILFLGGVFKPQGTEPATAILAFLLVISFLTLPTFSLLPNAILLNAPPPWSRRRRRFSGTTSSTVNTSSIQQHSSTNANDESQKAFDLTFR
ncbi:Uncharacterized protein TCM_015923 [Theobroma cacao]|uniref:Uncharacterized protein n=1 Tax=Theobroma cacao TaxID=3641 RepID=A0A061G4F2_THECC|nr:Uncharacterized protein TCM_015923 [Theobroma cacao]